jgi:hypothetical protein
LTLQNITLKNFLASVAGFVILFLFYHLPEFFQNYYHQPLIWLFELGMVVFVIASYVIIKKQKHGGFAGYGLFHLGKYKFNVVSGILLGFGFAALANLMTLWLRWNTMSSHLSFTQVIGQTFIFAIGTLLPSLAEDILTRGYLFAHWNKKGSRGWFICVSALVFALNHIFRLTHPDVMIYIFILGLVLAWCLIYTGSLWLTLGIHWGTNVAYQFFTNVITVRTVRETGLDNYILAGSYLLAWAAIVVLYKLRTFKIADPQEQNAG